MCQQSEKTCPGCGRVFTLQHLIDSPDIEPVGMQFVDPELAENMYFFNHICPGCGSTFVVSVIEFMPLIKEPIPDADLNGAEVCKEHCTRLDDLAICQSGCRYAPFRRFLLSLRNRRPGISHPSPSVA